MLNLQRKLVVVASWWQERLEPGKRELLCRWLFVNVIFCSVFLDIVNSLPAIFGFDMILFMAAMMQIANLVYTHLSPVLYVVTSLLNGFSLVIVGDFSIVHAALRLLRNPQPYFEYLGHIVSA